VKVKSIHLSSFLFACPKRNEAKKKGPENANFSLFGPLALHAFSQPKRLQFAPFSV
jgi:hypothetical protein